jgi:hypothetical protein
MRNGAFALDAAAIDFDALARVLLSEPNEAQLELF